MQFWYFSKVNLRFLKNSESSEISSNKNGSNFFYLTNTDFFRKQPKLHVLFQSPIYLWNSTLKFTKRFNLRFWPTVRLTRLLQGRVFGHHGERMSRRIRNFVLDTNCRGVRSKCSNLANSNEAESRHFILQIPLWPSVQAQKRLN